MSANLSLHSAPDAIEPVVGWRTWRISQTDQGLRLTSVAYWSGGWHWPARERLEAKCFKFGHKTEHVSPDHPCSCGIYAAREVKGARGYVNPYGVKQSSVVWLAIGRVNLWGKVVEHEDGFRAQYAYPKQLLLPDEIRTKANRADVPNLDEIAANLRDTYGVPVLIVHQKPSLIERLKGVR